MSDQYFTIQKVKTLISKNNWVLRENGDRFFLCQSDKPYMKTVDFNLTEDEQKDIFEWMDHHYSALNEEGYAKTC